jgi:hypothetical protein
MTKGGKIVCTNVYTSLPCAAFALSQSANSVAPGIRSPQPEFPVNRAVADPAGKLSGGEAA